MKQPTFAQVTTGILTLAGLFLLAIALATAGLIWNTRQAALSDAQEQAVRFINGAESSINRSLLGVDVLLASMDDLLGLSGLVIDWIDTQNASQLMHYAVDLNQMVRHVALITPESLVIAASDARDIGTFLKVPASFIKQALGQQVSSMLISAPLVSFASSERTLYFARPIQLGDRSKVLAVAEIPVSTLASILIQGVDIKGLEVTLERNNGQLLLSVPVMEQLSGQQLQPPAGDQQQDSSSTQYLSARLTGVPAKVVTRPILYQDILISASIPNNVTLTAWHDHRNAILAVGLAFSVVVVIASGLALSYIHRKAQDRLILDQSKASLDQALESMVSGFMLLNSELQIVRWNRRFESLFPWASAVLSPLLPFEKLMWTGAKFHLPHGNEGEHQLWVTNRMALQSNPQNSHEQIQPNGRVIQISERNTPEGGLVIVYQDITELRLAKAEVELLAFYDPLTALPNRRLLMDRLDQALAACARSGYCGALLFLDLDHFKSLNDTLGHDVGDLLLQQVAERLKMCVRDGDTVARLGGDEFVIMLEDLSENQQEAAFEARQIGEKIILQLNHPYRLATHIYRSTPSVGATLFFGSKLIAADLLKQADIAMYQVKSQGRNALCFFDPHMQTDITAHVQLENDLRCALLNHEFELYYQPQFEGKHKVVGAEVLIRWHHPLRGLVPPGEFIGVAEESELITFIGDWVLDTACQQLAHWQQNARSNTLHLSVNVSARQFRHPDFVSRVATTIADAGIAPRLLKLELTESLVLENINDTIEKMTAIKAMGVYFSVDDFGTGHSSLAYLTRLPLDQIKIDQSFVHNIGIKHIDDVMIQTIIGMARNLSLEVIAEGVETQAQQQFLSDQGCNLFQGYWLGKPMPLADFEVLLSRPLDRLHHQPAHSAR